MALQDIEVSQVQIDGNKEFNIADTAVRGRVTTLENSGFITLNDIPTATIIAPASTSSDLPTSEAVATFVEGKGYLTLNTLPIYDGTVQQGGNS